MQAQQFKTTMGLFATGVAVVTWQEATEIQGITVSSLSSLSLNPPLALFCIDQKAYVYPALCAQQELTINILAGDQLALAYRFAGPDRSDMEALFEPEQVALRGVLAQIRAQVFDRIPQGDHDIFVVRLLDSVCHPERPPLLYHRGTLFSAEGQ